MKRVTYWLRQKIQLANGLASPTIEVGQGLNSEAIPRLLELRDEYRGSGFEVDLVKEVVQTEIILATGEK